MNKPVPDDGPAKGAVVTKEELDLLLDDYYEARGWDKNGLPSKAQLKVLGLESYANIIEKKED
jgi:aldehyde:ferredoxin oxidoreductase